MKHLASILICCLLFACKTEIKKERLPFSAVEIKGLMKDSTLSVRAIEMMNDTTLIFPRSRYEINSLDVSSDYDFYSDWVHTMLPEMNKEKDSFIGTIEIEDKQIRSIASNSRYLFLLNVESPAIMNRIRLDTVLHARKRLQSARIVDNHPKAFYDSMDFWNDQEGIAIGDSTDGCLSVIITRNGGKTWAKLTCDQLPKGIEGEGAFAASDTNIAIVGDKTWVATTAGRIYFSADKGHTWSVMQTPIMSEKPTEGIYSIDFYDAQNGFGIGGDYTKAADSSANKMRTQDGGKTWQLVAENKSPGYRSCVQYVPNSNAKELVAVGFKGIDYSNDAGENWTHLSDEGFYTIRFLNDSTAYAAGKGRIAKLVFKSE